MRMTRQSIGTIALAVSAALEAADIE